MQTCDSPPTPYVRLHSLRAAIVLLATLIASPAFADVYKWVDAQGGIHFSEEPVRSAAALQRVVRAETRSRWNVVGSATDTASASEEPARASGRHVVRLEKSGHQMQVRASVNGAVSERFIVDTGAMMSAIPRSLARDLGLRIDASTPRVEVRGIRDQAQLAPVVTLRSVSLGGAQVEQLDVVVLDSLDTGLLGMSFFNHFRVQTDPQRGTLTLDEIASARNLGESALDYSFRWGAVDGASQYALEISSDASFRQVVEQTRIRGTATDLRELRLGELAPGTYYWRVAAMDDAGAQGPWTAPRDFRYR